MSLGVSPQIALSMGCKIDVDGGKLDVDENEVDRKLADIDVNRLLDDVNPVEDANVSVDVVA